MLPQSCESIQSAPDNASRSNTMIYVCMRIQVLIDDYLPLCLMACPTALNLALKVMRNHLLKTMCTTVPARIHAKNITHMRSMLVVWIKVHENSCIVCS